MSLPPIETPLGAMRFNSDSQKLEYWMGSAWMQIKTFSPNLDGGSRAIWAAGSSSTNVIDYVTIPTAGNAIDFGDTTLRKYNSGGASNTRGVFGGGDPAGGVNTLEFITISTTGDGVNFGDLKTALTYVAGCSSQTRLVIGGGKPSPSSYTNEMSFVTIASTGDSQNFGDLTLGRSNIGALASPTRGIFAGGYTPTMVNNIDFCTIASTGDAQDFGDITESSGTNSAQCGSSTRGIIWAGYPAGTNIDSLIIASKGNTFSFGDSTISLKYRNGTSDTVRGLSGGGQDGTGDGNTIEYINISEGGTAIDFGDLTTADHDSGACFSNGHGGLG